LSRAKSTKF